MIRNLKLKLILLAVLAITAFGALTSTSQAAQFTAPGAAEGVTTSIKFTLDGTGKTAHHVFTIGNTATTSTVSFTCEFFTAELNAHIIGLFNVKFTAKAQWHKCNAAGQAVTITNTGCILEFNASGAVTVANDAEKVCKHGAGNAPIDIEFTGCKVEVGSQALNGVKYHNLNAAGTTVGSNEGTKVTVELAISGITYNAVGANCPYGTTSNGSYTTGNTIVTGERGGAAVDIRWDA